MTLSQLLKQPVSATLGKQGSRKLAQSFPCARQASAIIFFNLVGIAQLTIRTTLLVGSAANHQDNPSGSSLTPFKTIPEELFSRSNPPTSMAPAPLHGQGKGVAHLRAEQLLAEMLRAILHLGALGAAQYQTARDARHRRPVDHHRAALRHRRQALCKAP